MFQWRPFTMTTSFKHFSFVAQTVQKLLHIDQKSAHRAHYGKSWHHSQNWKYITYRHADKENTATAPGQMLKNFCEDQSSRSKDMVVDTHTHTQLHFESAHYLKCHFGIRNLDVPMKEFMNARLCTNFSFVGQTIQNLWTLTKKCP